MSDLQPDHYRALLTYHTALRDFLNLSTSASKVNPKRAAKAREKLLKLSPTQFFELSTDVFDELQRRIDESREEPEFLLPKSTFHPKRNEAREKLGSLQQGRFRDLVSDIFYEIERRKYHEQHYPKRESIGSIDYSNKRSSKASTRNDNNARDSDHSNKNGVVGLQSTTVIPTKAELAWSSDEEENSDFDEEKTSKILPHKVQDQRQVQLEPSPVQHHRNNSNTDYERIQQAIPNRNSDLSSKKRNSDASDKDTLSEMAISSPKHSNNQLNRGLSVSKTRNKDREIELLLEEGTKMDRTITQLEQKIALLQSKSDKFENETKELQSINQRLTTKITSLEEDLTSKDVKVKGLEQDSLSEGIDNNPTRKLQVDTKSGQIDQSALDELKKEVLDWRHKFEDLKLQKVEELLLTKDMSQNSLSKLLDNNGLIPLSLINLLHKSIESFLLFLNEEKSNQKVNVNSLFDHISKVSNISGKIASLAPQSDKCDLIRASVSHAITSARYYALYSDILPKLVVESAVSEIAFSVCDLISEVKLNKDDTKFSTSEFEIPNVVSKNIDEDGSNDISPVRPLRMTKKNFETPKSSTNNESSSNPRPLNLTIISQPSNNDGVSPVTKKPYQGLNGLSSPRTSAKNMELGNKISSSPENMKVNDAGASGINGSILSSNATTITPLKKNGVSSIVSRYSPESEKKPVESDNTSISPLRKSSSSNILAKVRQFEEQGNVNSNASVSPQRSVVSPFSDNKFGKAATGSGAQRTSLDNKSDILNENDVNKSDGLKSSIVPETINVRDPLGEKATPTDPINSSVSTSTRLPPPVKERGNEEKGGSDDDDDDDSLTSVDKLKGAIKKNADLKPKPVVIQTEDEEEEDLNELPREVNDIHEIKKDNSSKEPEDFRFGNGNGNLKIERKQLNERFIEPPSNLNNGSRTATLSKTAEESKNSITPLIGKSASIPQQDEIIQDDFNTAQEELTSRETEVESEPEERASEIRSNGRINRTEGRDLEEDFDVGQFDIEDPDNTLSELLLYLEHQTVKVISTIQTLLTSIKAADSTKGELRSGSRAINAVVSQMVDATSNSMNQSRNAQLKEHGIWVVQSLEDSGRRMDMLCNSSSRDGEDNEDDNEDYADKHFKQRLAGIAFDVAKCTKELVKTVEEANLKEEIEHLDARLGQ